MMLAGRRRRDRQTVDAEPFLTSKRWPDAINASGQQVKAYLPQGIPWSSNRHIAGRIAMSDTLPLRPTMAPIDFAAPVARSTE